MSYEVVEVIGLPVMEKRVVYVMSDGKEITDLVATGDTVRKEPGEKLTAKELQQHGQTSEDIAALVKSKALKETA
jgi:hypothetical protein